MGERLDRIIHWCMNPSIAAIVLVTSVITSGLSYYGLRQSSISLFSFLIPLVVLVVIGVVNTQVSGISITCLQEDFGSVERQHYKEYWMYRGVANIEAFMQVPSWISRFEIKMVPNGPLSVSHDSPADIKEKNGKMDTMVGHDGPKNFDFQIKVTGEPDELRSSTYNLEFVDMRTNRTIHKIRLLARPDFPNPKDDLPEGEDAEEWGVSG